MVEVFKTDVQEVRRAGKLIKLLLGHFPSHKINFDLKDCDRILRIEGASINTVLVINTLKMEGFSCEVLEG